MGHRPPYSNPLLPDPPEWFIEAVKELWAKVLFEGFSQFPWNQRYEQPFHPELACWGNFYRGFDEQPGIKDARIRCLQMCYLSSDERRQIIESLEARGITYCSNLEGFYGDE